MTTFQLLNKQNLLRYVSLAALRLFLFNGRAQQK
jgi:hypothetical protein